MRKLLIGGLTALLILGSVVLAEDPPANQSTTKPTALTVSDKLAVTDGTLTVGAATYPYAATAGYIALKDDQGKLHANIFSVSYVLKGSGVGGKGSEKPTTTAPSAGPSPLTPDPSASARPVTFIFNGGPGAASVWLHLGTAGPKRVDIPADGTPPKAPFKVVDNPSSWLPSTDLVFVDPVGTGYSRAATPEQSKEFFGVQEDIAAMGEFVRIWLTKNERWNSPVFLAGESYGTTRAAGLSEHLQERQGVSVSGVILISSVLNFATLQAQDGNDLPYIVYLPTYTALAHYHGKLKGDLPKLLKDAEKFAANDYVSALTKGDSLSATERDNIAARLSELTSLSKDYILQSNLRIPPSRFMKELLRNEKKVIGRYDGRLTGDATDPANDSAEWDPSFDGFYTAYASAMNDYVRKTLHYENDLQYEVISNKVHPWNFNAGGLNGYLYVGDNLRNAMTHNPNLKLLVAAGHYDLATPYFAADYTVNHLQLAKDLRGNITQAYFPAGHMLYHEKSGLDKLQKDVAALIESALRDPVKPTP